MSGEIGWARLLVSPLRNVRRKASASSRAMFVWTEVRTAGKMELRVASDGGVESSVCVRRISETMDGIDARTCEVRPSTLQASCEPIR